MKPDAAAHRNADGSNPLPVLDGIEFCARRRNDGDVEPSRAEKRELPAQEKVRGYTVRDNENEAQPVTSFSAAVLDAVRRLVRRSRGAALVVLALDRRLGSVPLSTVVVVLIVVVAVGALR